MEVLVSNVKLKDLINLFPANTQLRIFRVWEDPENNKVPIEDQKIFMKEIYYGCLSEFDRFCFRNDIVMWFVPDWRMNYIEIKICPENYLTSN